MTGFKLVLLAGLLALGACSIDSQIFDNNCSGNGWFSDQKYCTEDFKPYAGPYAAPR